MFRFYWDSFTLLCVFWFLSLEMGISVWCTQVLSSALYNKMNISADMSYLSHSFLQLGDGCVGCYGQVPTQVISNSGIEKIYLEAKVL